jgi:hypothetical protein
MPERSSSGAEREPPAARWIGRYLALIIFGTGLVSSLIGLLIAATLALSNANHTMSEHEKLLDGVKEEQTKFRTDMVNADRRLNEGATNLGNSERQQDHTVAELQVRIAVLEAQLKLFADRTIAPAPRGLQQ